MKKQIKKKIESERYALLLEVMNIECDLVKLKNAEGIKSVKVLKFRTKTNKDSPKKKKKSQNVHKR